MSASLETAVIKVGRIRFLNTIPFFAPGDTPGSQIQFVDGVPQEINAALAAGGIDAGLASSLAYAGSPEKFLILPGLCIGAGRKSRSVMFYSRFHPADLGGKTIALSAKSLSAASLLKILFLKKWRVNVRFETVDMAPPEMEKRYAGFLLIGDEALFYDPKDWKGHDLSEIWWDWTGAPFCFALWLVRREICEQAPERVLALQSMLRANIQNSGQDLRECLSARPDISPDKIENITDYLGHLKYSLTPELLRGLTLFFDLAHEAGLIPERAALHFFERHVSSSIKGAES